MTRHFSSEEWVDFFQYIDCHSAILKVSTLNFTYVVQLFLLYKMVKKKLKKKFTFESKMANTTVIVGGFWWFFNKNQTFLAIFITMKQLYSKMDMLFGISVENCIESYIIWKKFFSVKNSPVVPHSSHFFKFCPLVP